MLFRSDRIVELTILKLMPDGERIVRTRRFNPEMPIPAESTAIQDVYKRQVLTYGLYSRPELLSEGSSFLSLSLFVGISLSITAFPVSVSYTHLDVYKRQAICYTKQLTRRDLAEGIQLPVLTLEPYRVCLLYTSRCV